MNKHNKLLFAALGIIVVALAIAITRFFSDTGINIYDGGTQSVIAKRLGTDDSSNLLFQDASGMYGIADSSERVIVSPEWEELSFTGTGMCIAAKHIKGVRLIGCIDYEGNVIVPFIYDSIERHFINGYVFYTAAAHSDGSCVVYSADLVPAFTQSWKSYETGENELTLKTNIGAYTYLVSENGFSFKNAALRGKVLSSEYRLDITSKLLLSKLSVSMLEQMSDAAGKYIEYAFTENENILSEIKSAENAAFVPLFPDDEQLVTKRFKGISDIFLYSTKSDDDVPHYAVAVTADTELTYFDANEKLSRMNGEYKAVIEFSGDSADDLAAVSGSFTEPAPEYPLPEPEHPAINGFDNGEETAVTTAQPVTET